MPQGRPRLVVPLDCRKFRMRAVLLTTDPVLLGFARVVLTDSGIEAVLADQYTSAIEGSVGIFPRRLLVPADAWHRARRALENAGLTAELVPEGDPA